MGAIIRFFQSEMETPGIFSLFHISALVIIIGLILSLCIFYKDCNKKTFKRIFLIVWSVLVVFEIIKQLVLSYHDGNPGYFEYDHYHFPFHLCSTIYYITPLYLLINEEKHPFIYQALTGFIATYLVLSGLIVCLYPGLVMGNYIFINIQTMVHHGALVAIGLFTFAYHRKSFNIKYYFKAQIIQGIFAILAIIVNVLFTPIALKGIDMFYLNPYEITVLPVGSTIQEKFGFIPYAISYLLTLFLLGLLIYFIESLFNKKYRKQLQK